MSHPDPTLDYAQTMVTEIYDEDQGWIWFCSCGEKIRKAPKLGDFCHECGCEIVKIERV